MRNEGSGVGSAGIHPPGSGREDFRIVVDLPWDASACMGTGAYGESMVRSLAEAAAGSSITLIVSPGAPRPIQLPNVRYVSLPGPEGMEEGTRQVSIPSFLRAVRADCFFAPATLLPLVKVCPMVSTVFDLTFEDPSNGYAPGLVAYLKRWFDPSLEVADRIVTISNPVREDLLLRKKLSPEKVSVIETPIRDIFREGIPEGEEGILLNELGIGAPFFFHVSNLSVHKNMEFGVRVFAEYLRRHPDHPHSLLIAGGGYAPSRPPDLLGLAQSLGIGSRVRYLGKVTDRALAALYRRSDRFLFPSLAEGWGLPVVEARSLGARVLASPFVPSAEEAEKIPLELEAWVCALEQPGTPPSGASGISGQEAGKRLLEVLKDAIRCSPEATESPSKIARMAIEESTGKDSSIAIRGDWYSPSGFGQAARGVFAALDGEGLRPAAFLVPKDRLQEKRLWRKPVLLHKDAADLWIHHLPPDYIDLELRGKHVSYFFWETDRIPQSVSGSPWGDVLRGLDEIWVASAFLRDVLRRSGVDRPCEHIPLPVDTDHFGPGARRAPPVELPPGFDPSWTVFLYVGTWDSRKRPDILVRAFSKAFSTKDRALLLIKSYVTGNPERDREILGEWSSASLAGPAHVRILPKILSSGEMAELFRSATAFATASRGEGYCLPAVQAMSTGIPVVAPAWSAFLDFPTLPVRVTLENVPREVTLPGYSPDQRWGVVDEEDLARNLRWVHENRGPSRRLGLESREWVLRNASQGAVGRRLKERIHSLTATELRRSPEEALR